MYNNNFKTKIFEYIIYVHLNARTHKIRQLFRAKNLVLNSFLLRNQIKVRFDAALNHYTLN